MTAKQNLPAIRFPEFEGEWSAKNLGDIAKFSKGKGISKADIIKNGSLECIRYGELYTHYNEVISEVISRTNGNPESLVLSKINDVIIPASGETQIDIAKASCVMKAGIALGGDLNILRLNENGIFISYYLNSKRKLDIAALAQGISVVHLYASQLSLLNLNIPSLPEQQKIAAFLTAVDDKIQQLTRKKALLEQYKKGVMQQLFSQQLRFTDDAGKDFPDWEEKTLGEIGEIVGGGTPDTFDESLWNGGIQWFTPTEIKTKYLSKSLRTLSEEGVKKSSAKLLPIGTLLLSSRATVGDVSIALTECSTNQGFQNIVVNECHNNEFIYYWILNNKKEFITKASGSTFLEINKTEISKLSITIPSKAEQQKIASFLSAIDEKINHVATQLQHTQQWKKGLLQQMFV